MKNINKSDLKYLFATVIIAVICIILNRIAPKTSTAYGSFLNIFKNNVLLTIIIVILFALTFITHILLRESGKNNKRKTILSIFLLIVFMTIVYSINKICFSSLIDDSTMLLNCIFMGVMKYFLDKYFELDSFKILSKEFVLQYLMTSLSIWFFVMSYGDVLLSVIIGIVIIIIVLFVLKGALFAGKSSGGSHITTTSSYSRNTGYKANINYRNDTSSNSVKQLNNKDIPKELVIRKDCAYIPEHLNVYKVHSIGGDYVCWRNDGIIYGKESICTVSDYESGKFRIYRCKTGKEIHSSSVPWKKWEDA